MDNNTLALLMNVDYVKEQLKYFREREWKVTDLKELRDSYMNRLGVTIVDTFTIKKGSLIFRARPNRVQKWESMSDNTNLFDNISELGINSKERTIYFGRANYPENPVFYACPSKITAIHEVAQYGRVEAAFSEYFRLVYDVNDRQIQVEKERHDEVHSKIGQFIDSEWNVVTLSEWEIQDDLKLASFVNREMLRDSRIKNIEYNAYFGESLILLAKGYKIRKSLNLIRDFIYEQFIKLDIKSQSDYVLSSFFSNLIYEVSAFKHDNSHLDLAGIMYASVAEGFRGINFVFTESTVRNNKLKFNSAEYHFIRRPSQVLINASNPSFKDKIYIDKDDWMIHGYAKCDEATGNLDWRISKLIQTKTGSWIDIVDYDGPVKIEIFSVTDNGELVPPPIEE